MTAPSCPGCRERDERLAALEARVRELEAQLGRNASNSSLPPSANPPQAPPPVVKTPTGKKGAAANRAIRPFFAAACRPNAFGK